MSRLTNALLLLPTLLYATTALAWEPGGGKFPPVRELPLLFTA